MNAPTSPQDAVRMSRLRRTIARRLRESVTTKPPVTLHTTAPAGPLLAAADAARAAGRRAGITAFVAEATVRALASHPALNGHIAGD